MPRINLNVSNSFKKDEMSIIGKVNKLKEKLANEQLNGLFPDTKRQ